MTQPKKTINLVRALVVGCGNRGDVYSTYALKHPDRLAIVGFADPRPHVRKLFELCHKQTVETDKIFENWTDIFKDDKEEHVKLADCVIITLPDKLHKDAAIAFLSNGYHILLEKPMATSLADCKEIAIKCEENPHLINAVCHVLRYYNVCIKLKQILDAGLIGDIVNINHTEPVGNWHFAHSFVRGNWRNEAESTFSLLAKCCHDVDLLVYWMGTKKRCVRVASFGSLVHFRTDNAPKNAGPNCFQCPVEADCCYSTKKIYLNKDANPNGWPYSVVLHTDGPLVLDGHKEDIEDLLQKTDKNEKIEILSKALQHPLSQYGRCVYKCDNDVCDNQTVVLNFNDNSIATLTMVAFSESQCQRRTIIYGTKGQLEWDDSKSTTNIYHFDFLTRQSQIIDGRLIDTNEETETNELFRKLKGHGGTDYILIDSFVNAIMHNNKSYILTDVNESFRSHLVVFAAEMSRRQNKIININQDDSFSF